MLESLSQPPCEAVSWNDDNLYTLPLTSTSASLWGCELKCIPTDLPPLSVPSASLWGCELKFPCIFFPPADDCQPPCEAVSWNISMPFSVRIPTSASLWGCELKCWYSARITLNCCQPPCEAVSWNAEDRIYDSDFAVSLLVRLWVEIWLLLQMAIFWWSASLWGCELK